MANKHELMLKMNSSRKKARQILELEMAKTYAGERSALQGGVKDADSLSTPPTTGESPTPPQPVVSGSALSGKGSTEAGSEQLPKKVGMKAERLKKAGKEFQKNRPRTGVKSGQYKNVALPPAYHRKVNVYARLAQTNALAFVCQAVDYYLEREQSAGRLPKIEL